MKPKMQPKNVAGVKAVVEEIEVVFYSNISERTDKEVAYEIVTALKNSWLIPDDNINVKVEGGWVTRSKTTNFFMC